MREKEASSYHLKWLLYICKGRWRRYSLPHLEESRDVMSIQRHRGEEMVAWRSAQTNEDHPLSHSPPKRVSIIKTRRISRVRIAAGRTLIVD